MARGTLDAAAAAAARWAGIKIVECPLCGAVMEAEQFRAGDTWRCEDCGSTGQVLDDAPIDPGECFTCKGVGEVNAIDIVTGDENRMVPCPDCTPSSAGIGCNVRDDAPLPQRGLGELLPPVESYDEPAKVFYEREGRMPSPAERMAEKERLELDPCPDCTPAGQGPECSVDGCGDTRPHYHRDTLDGEERVYQRTVPPFPPASMG